MYKADDHTFALCAYGSSPYLEACINSLLEQTQPTTIILCTSTPNNLISALVEKYELRFFVNGGEGGIANDWNFAISCANTPLVTIAHQDDIYLPQYASRMLSMINEASHPLLFFSDYAELRGDAVETNNRLLGIKRFLLTPLKVKSLGSVKVLRRRILSFGSAICCPSVTLCMDNLNVPVFHAGMKSNLDWEAWESISRLEGSFVYAPDVLMYHRIHEGSETSKLINDRVRDSEDLEMLRKFWPKPLADFLYRFYRQGQASNEL